MICKHKNHGYYNSFKRFLTNIKDTHRKRCVSPKYRKMVAMLRSLNPQSLRDSSLREGSLLLQEVGAELLAAVSGQICGSDIEHSLGAGHALGVHAASRSRAGEQYGTGELGVGIEL